jgi:hypothetical protein
MLPEIRAAPPGFRRGNRADSPQLEMPPRRSRNDSRVPGQRQKYFFFMTFLQQRGLAHLEIPPASVHLRARILDRTVPAWRGVDHENSLRFVNRLRRGG